MLNEKCLVRLKSELILCFVSNIEGLTLSHFAVFRQVNVSL